MIAGKNLFSPNIRCVYASASSVNGDAIRPRSASKWLANRREADAYRRCPEYLSRSVPASPTEERGRGYRLC
jgi:hypothetical protein